MGLKLAKWWLILTGLCGGLPVWALTPAEADIQTVVDCMRQNLIEHGALRELGIQSTGPGGTSQLYAVNLYWQPDSAGQAQVSLRVTRPRDMAGSAYLLRKTPTEDELYVYLPATGKARRIAGEGHVQSLWGTDFSYGDIQYVLGLIGSGASSRKADARLHDRPVYVVETRTDPELAGFGRVLSSIDKQSCTVLRSEFYAGGETPAKILDADMSLLFQTETDEKPVWMVLGYTMRNLEQGTKSRLSLGEIQLLEKIPKRAFDPATFYTPFEGQHRSGSKAVTQTR